MADCIGRSLVIRANSRSGRSHSFKISFSLIEIGIVIPFLFFYVTSLDPLEEVVNRLRTVEAMDGDFDALEDLGVASTR